MVFLLCLCAAVGVASAQSLTAELSKDRKYLQQNYLYYNTDPLVVTLGNAGTEAITVSGTASSNVQMDSVSMITIQPGETVQVNVFPASGLAVGQHTANLTFTTSTSEEKQLTITYQVMGAVSMELGEDMLQLVDFGNVNVNGELPVKTFTLVSSRNEVTNLKTVTSSDFTITPATAQIPANGSMTFSVSPKTPREGLVEEYIDITDDFGDYTDEDSCILNVILRYMGVTNDSKALVATANTYTRNLDENYVADMSENIYVSLANTGEADVQVSMSHDANSQFDWETYYPVQDQSVQTIPAGDTIEIAVLPAKGCQ